MFREKEERQRKRLALSLSFSTFYFEYSGTDPPPPQPAASQQARTIQALTRVKKRDLLTNVIFGDAKLLPVIPSGCGFAARTVRNEAPSPRHFICDMKEEAF